MKESRKQFIREAHKEACTTWKIKIENEFPQLFVKEELKVGSWWTTKANRVFTWRSDTIIIDEIDENNRVWSYNNLSNINREYLSSQGRFLDVYRPATNQEVEQALKKEAKKRGFKEGDNIGGFNVMFGSTELIGGCGVYSISVCETMFFFGGCCIMQEGKWATIVEEDPIKELTVAEVEKALGHKVKIVK